MEITSSPLDDLDGVLGVAMTHLLELGRTEGTHVHLARLAAGSSRPRHPAGPDQLFHVVSERGSVATSDDVRVPVGPGDSVRWTRGEEHTPWAETGMTVLIVQHRAAD
ncbi:MAG: cupin domain-containing protein [Brachybacterium sp.]|uniref:cupin domain-containing protein n=1 Tax=Brachybacterium sp. TaxID=1891286 RepID=UPI003F93A4DC